MAIHHLPARFRRDRHGNVAVFVSIAMIAMLGFAAFAIDIGKLYLDRRKAQATVDLAALSAASQLSDAVHMANRTVALNMSAPNVPLVIEYGAYTPDITLVPSDRFRPGPPQSANAVRVTLQSESRLFFSRVLTGTDSVPLRTVATASSTGFAAFAIGSRLVDVDGGLLNQILGGLLGANLTLSAMDYQSLLDARVDVFDLLNAITVHAHLTGPTYQSVMTSNVSIADVIAAESDFARQPAALNALRSVARALGGASSHMSLTSMFDLGPYAALPLGQAPQSAGTVSLFDVVSAAAQMANGQNEVTTGLDLQVPGIIGATLSVAVGTRPAGSSWFAIGAYGTSVHTAQTRILLAIELQGSGPLPSTKVPIYVQVAEGTATLDALACGYPDVRTSRVTLGVTPGIVDAWIGSVPPADFADFAWPINPQRATLLQSSALSITAQAHATIANRSSTDVPFTYADITAPNGKTVSTTDLASSLMGALVGDLRVGVAFGTFGVNLPDPVAQAVSASLGAVATPLDAKLATILATLGVGLGQADVWVSGLRCDGAVLVN